MTWRIQRAPSQGNNTDTNIIKGKINEWYTAQSEEWSLWVVVVIRHSQKKVNGEEE